MLKIIGGSILFITVLTSTLSCKKHDRIHPPSIVGKWNVDKLILWIEIPSEVTTKDTTFYTGTMEYFDFRADGNTYTKIYDFSNSTYSYDTSMYSVSGNTFTAKRGVETTIWTIQVLTDHLLQIYRKTTTGSLTNELWFLLSR
ncbi:MAG: hypothetical protein ABI472_06495 [Ginsengibacter sp.]